MTRTLLALFVVASIGFAAAPAQGATLVGIGDQNPQVFGDPLFKELKLKRARIVVPWNVAQKRGDRQYLDNYLFAAAIARVETLVSFSSPTGSRCPRRPCKLPSTSQFTKAFKAFRKRWPRVKIISAWNEANHRSQPTFKNPKRAAQFFNVIRKRCRGCKIMAADVIDETNMVRWLKVFKRHAKGERLWGLHNYRDTNPRKGQVYGGTRRLTRTVRGDIWLTETGGIVKFTTPSGGKVFKHSPARANKAVKRMFSLAKRYRKRIKRLYIYNWYAPRGNNRFDSGLLNANGTPRPAYGTVKKTLRTKTFNP